MSAENEIDPGDILAYLQELIQVKEIIIARLHVKIMVHRYHTHWYHYSRHYISFI